MNIKEITINGFKSFRDKTIITIDEPVVGIVGPNGCGKSNIVDAMKWVLGEQSAKSLRGSAMDDVIYNGGANGKGAGLAEVSIKFDLKEGRAPSKYLDYSEIQITRRLYRGGESEYLINKTQCRLKDIHDFIMGTGAGARAYAIVSQGHIEKFTMAKPFERRFYIEEAADITRYKVRKEAAERKIDSTKQNLLRLNDIIRELQKQNSTLKRQADAAEKYKVLKLELRENELKIASSNYLILKNKMNDENELYESLKSELHFVENDINKKELSIEDKKLTMQEEESFLSSLQEKIYEGKKELQQAETDIKIKEKEIDEISSQVNNDLKYIETLNLKVDALNSEKLLLGEGFSALEEVNAEKKDLETKEKVLQEKKKELEEALFKKENARNEVINALTIMSQARNKLQFIDQNITTQEVRLGQKEKEKEDLQIKQETLLDKLGKLNKELENLRLLKDDSIREKEVLDSKLTKWKNELSLNQGQYDILKNELTAKTSRLASLEELRDNYEGYEDGVKSIMLDYPGKESLHGLIGDNISIEPKYEVALESILGERIQGIIINNVDEGCDAISHLRTQTSGRSCFLPLNLRTQVGQCLEGAKRVSETGAGSFLGYLRDKIKIKENFKQIADSLFKNIALVEDLDSAIKIWKQENICDTIVTLKGDVITPEGVVSGGSVEAISSGILQKKREIEELNKKIDELEIKHTLIVETTKKIENQIFEAQEKSDILLKFGHSEDLKILDLEKDLNSIKEEIERIDSTKEIIEHEIKRLDEESKGLERESNEARQVIDDHEKIHAIAQSNLSEIESFEKDLRGMIEKDTENITERKIHFASLRERADSFKVRVTRIERDINETASDITSFTEKIKNADKRKISLRKECSEITVKIDNLVILSEKAEENLKLRREKFLNEHRYIIDVEANLKELRNVYNTKMNEYNQIGLSLNETRFKIETISKEIFNCFGDDLQEVSRKFLEENKMEKIFDDIENIKNDILDIKAKIEAMGEVNIIAIEEYKKVSERLDFLVTQKKDLEKAVTSLEKTITKINKTSAERFEAAFNAINDHFKRVFPKLFKGGSASLILTDPEDLLNTGVDIIVQPPGKKFHNINLFSGGEKALTAISLIFSIFLINPAPFCVLDEVDAPLDDSNISRFNSIIREMANNTQFVLITHNKKTMEVADKLYGITLEESGYSKLVSVRFVRSKEV